MQHLEIGLIGAGVVGGGVVKNLIRELGYTIKLLAIIKAAGKAIEVRRSSTGSRPYIQQLSDEKMDKSR